MRTLPPALAAHIATGRTTLARCLRLDLVDGTALGITDHDQDISVDLGDGALSYSAATGALPSAIGLALGLDADSLEVSGPLTGDFTRAAVVGGRFNRAAVRIFDANWAAPAQFARLLKGKVANPKVDGGRFTLEVRCNTDAFNQTIGRVLSPQCSHEFGVFDPPRSYCQATRAAYAATVASVTDAMAFTVAWTGAAPTDVDGATLAFTAGALAGLRDIELFALTGAAIETFLPLAEAPAIGDALTVYEGCAKSRDACKAKGQILNFGGFPDLIGTDQYLKFPVPTA